MTPVMKTFNDIKFTPNKDWGKWSGKLKIDDYILSVVAGERLYSSPRTFEDSVDQYNSFEVAVLNLQTNFVTDFFVDDMKDEVLGWQSRNEINDIISRIENHEKI